MLEYKSIQTVVYEYRESLFIAEQCGKITGGQVDRCCQSTNFAHPHAFIKMQTDRTTATRIGNLSTRLQQICTVCLVLHTFLAATIKCKQLNDYNKARMKLITKSTIMIKMSKTNLPNCYGTKGKDYVTHKYISKYNQNLPRTKAMPRPQ